MDGKNFLNYSLEGTAVSTRELEKIIEKRNVHFNNHVDDIINSSLREENAVYSKTVAKEIEDSYLSYLSDEEKTSYEQNSSGWSAKEKLDFWNNHNDEIVSALKNSSADKSQISSFSNSLSNWNTASETEEKRESIRTEIKTIQTTIQNLENKMEALDTKSETFHYDQMNLQQEIDYQKSLENKCNNDLSQSVVKIAFQDKSQFEYFQNAMREEDIACTAMPTKINGQYVMAFNEGFLDQVKTIAEEHENIPLTIYQEKSIQNSFKQAETRDEYGRIIYQDNSDRDYIASGMYSSVGKPIIYSGGIREVASTISALERVSSVLTIQNYEVRTSIFSHSSSRDVGYEYTFLSMEQREERLSFMEKKYGVSREDIYDSNKESSISVQSDDPTDIRSLGKNNFENQQLEGMLKDKQTLEILSKKYGLDTSLVKESTKLEQFAAGAEKRDLTKFSMAVNDINVKLLDNLQGKLVYNGKSMIVNGRLDLDTFIKSGMTAKSLGISQEEFQILKGCAAKDKGLVTKLSGGIMMSGLSAFNKGMQLSRQMDSDSDMSWYNDLNKAKSWVNNVTTSVENVRKFAREFDISDYKLQLKSKKAANVKKMSEKEIQKTEKKLKKQNKTLSHKTKSGDIKKAGEKEAKRLLKKQRFDNSLYGRIYNANQKLKEEARRVAQKAIEKSVVGKWLQTAAKALKKFIGNALKYVGIAMLALIVIIMTVVLIIALICTVPSLFEQPEIEKSVMYKLYEHGMEEEQEWLEELRDTDFYWENHKELVYGYNWYYWEGKDRFDRYINNKVNHATSNKGEVSINPFDFTPADSVSKETDHKVTCYDGGVEVGIISNFNIDYKADENGKITLGEDHWKYGGGHTCNIKDIICMLDVLMDFDSTGDWTDQSLQDSIGQTEFKNAWGNVKHAGKCIGLGLASLWSDDAWGSWAEEMDAGSGTIGYYQLQGYMDGLFSASHQETLELEVVTFPVDTLADAKAPTKAAGGKEAGLQMALNDNVIRCPGGELDETYTDTEGKEHEIHACEVYDGFKPFFYDMNKAGIATTIPPQFKFGLEGDDGKMHPVDNEVYFKSDEEFCLPSGLATANDFNTAFWENLFKKYKDNDHWEYEQGKDETKTNDKEYGELDDFDKDVVGGDTKSSYSFDRDFSNNSPNQYFTVTHTWYSFTTDTKEKVIGQKDVDYGHMEDCSGCQTIPVAPYIVCPYGGQHYVIDGYKKQDITENVTIYDIIKHTETLHWDLSTCEGHTGYYCGGHLRCHVTGIVYSMRNKDVSFAMGELELEEGEGYSLKPPVGTYTDKYGDLVGKEVDYSTAEQAYLSGLNINTDYDILSVNYFEGLDSYWKFGNLFLKDDTLLNHLRLCEDIFSIDAKLIRYGRNQFRYNDYRQYEGWTEEKVLFALLKYGQDWNDIYGFDIATEMGFGEISASDMEKIDKALYNQYGSVYDKTRKHVVNLALAAVGNGSYDSNPHHWHAYTATKHDGVTCTATDCSGFASYPLIQTERDLQIKLNTPNNSGGWAWSCSELAGFKVSGLKSVSQHEISPYKDGTYVVNSDFSNCKPGDIISYVTGDEGAGNNHSVVFIGVLDEELELSTGTIQPGEVLIVDCTTITEGGNIYFRGYADSGLIPWSTIKNWPSKYSKGDRQLWVRDITYGMKEE